MLKIVLCLVSLTGILSTVYAENISNYVMILRDERLVNNGKAFELLKPANAVPFWQNKFPMSGKAELNIWFPVSEPVMLSSIRAESRYEKATAAMLSSNGQKFKFIHKSGNLEFYLKPPLSTNALRFDLTNISNYDHGVLTYSDAKSPGKLLYKNDDIKLKCAAKFNVFDLTDPIKLEVQVSDSIKLVKKFKLFMDMRTFQGTIVKQKSEIKYFSLVKKNKLKIPFEFLYNRQGPYFVTVHLYDDERKILLSAKRIIIGIRNPELLSKGNVKEFKSLSKDEIISIDERLKRNSTIWSADATQGVTGRGRQPGEVYFKKIKSGGGEMLMSYLRYSDFEPLPGVYNFEYFDHMVKNAGKHGLGLNLGLWWWDFRGPTQYWLSNEHKLKKDGSIGKGWDGIYSLFSSKFNKHATRAVELMIKRYRNCPEVWLWHPHPYGAVDHDGHGVKDYHPQALKAWHKYLKTKYKTISSLNQVYNTNYKNWTLIQIPESNYEKLRKADKLAESTRTLNYNQTWLDWLDFYHQSLLDMRINMMKIVRKYDNKRGIGGVNATGGVGKANETFKSMADYNAFYGDQGLNINHQVRRLVAKQQYGLKLRHEDIIPVTIGRRGLTKEKIIDRTDWLAFQCTFLGLEHFNYVFTAWTNSPFWDRFFANPISKRLVKESSKAKLVERKLVYLHSFLTDTIEGKYNYQGISIYRWWLMNGFSYAMLSPGNYFEILSLGGNLSRLQDMKLAIDDSSRVMRSSTVNTLCEFVKNGGKLVLLAASGEKTVDEKGDFQLLRRLGYGDTSKLNVRNLNSATLTFNKNNGVFRKTVTIPVNFWCGLNVPKGGKALGYIGEKIGAVVWPYGKGEIVLIGGLPGAIPESLGLDLYEKFKASKKKKYTHVWKVWSNGERELAFITTMLTKDLAEWVSIPPQFYLNEDFNACLKIKGNTRLIYMYNQGSAQIPVFRMKLTNGKYRITCETLTQKYNLGVHGFESLFAPGISMPELKSKRFMMLRIEPVW